MSSGVIFATSLALTTLLMAMVVVLGSGGMLPTVLMSLM